MEKHAKPSSEPFWWALFGAGGAVAALCIPVLLLLTGLAMPLGWVEAPSHAEALALVRHPLASLLLFAVISLSLFHWAHRFRYTLYDGLQIKHLNEVIAAACYGGAVAVSIFAGLLLW